MPTEISFKVPVTLRAYVRQSSNPADPKPYQVRVNLPDQTYIVVGRFASAAADRFEREDA